MWFCTCFGVILLGVDVGLGVGVICALFAVVLTLSRYVDLPLGFGRLVTFSQSVLK